MPTLYIVGTPIGNLEDVTMRALRVLREVGLIAAEDTRVTRKLLQRYEIRTPITSFHDHNKAAKLPTILSALKDKDVALVSDAGMPGINDPGAELVRAAATEGFAVVVVPGPSALTSAVAGSGLPIDQFIYLGFLPRRRSQRKRLLETLRLERRALVVFEAPHRMRAALEDVLVILGDRQVAVCRELTKLHEEVFRGSVSMALEHFDNPRGEFTLVVEGSREAAVDGAQMDEEARTLLARFRADGRSARDSVALAVESTGLPKRRVYRMWVEVAGSLGPEG